MAEPRPLKAGFCLWRWLMVVVAAGGQLTPLTQQEALYARKL